MIKNIKAILLITVVAVAAANAVGLFMLKEFEETKRLRTEDQLRKEEIAKEKADKQLSSLASETDLIHSKLTDKRKEAASLESELAEYKRQARLTGQRIIEIDGMVISTERKIKQLNANIAELKVRTVNILKDTLKLTGELTLLQKTTEAFKERLAQYLGGKSPKEVNVKGSDLSESQLDILKEFQPATLRPSLVGEVLIVNREFDFIIVNLGRSDGVEEGMVFDISRDNKVLSRAEVETARTNISAAALVDKETISQIRAGDKALLYPKTGIQILR